MWVLKLLNRFYPANNPCIFWNNNLNLCLSSRTVFFKRFVTKLFFMASTLFTTKPITLLYHSLFGKLWFAKRLLCGATTISLTLSKPTFAATWGGLLGARAVFYCCCCYLCLLLCGRVRLKASRILLNFLFVFVALSSFSSGKGLSLSLVCSVRSCSAPWFVRKKLSDCQKRAPSLLFLTSRNLNVVHMTVRSRANRKI